MCIELDRLKYKGINMREVYYEFQDNKDRKFTSAEYAQIFNEGIPSHDSVIAGNAYIVGEIPDLETLHDTLQYIGWPGDDKTLIFLGTQRIDVLFILFLMKSVFDRNVLVVKPVDIKITKDKFLNLFGEDERAQARVEFSHLLPKFQKHFERLPAGVELNEKYVCGMSEGPPRTLISSARVPSGHVLRIHTGNEYKIELNTETWHYPGGERQIIPKESPEHATVINDPESMHRKGKVKVTVHLTPLEYRYNFVPDADFSIEKRKTKDEIKNKFWDIVSKYYEDFEFLADEDQMGPAFAIVDRSDPTTEFVAKIKKWMFVEDKDVMKQIFVDVKTEIITTAALENIEEIGNGNKGWVRFINIGFPGKLLVIGDLHCSIRSLCALLTVNKEEFFEKDSLTLKQDRYLAFTGDIGDRGPIGLQMMVLVAQIYLANPAKVFWCCGNHEECQTFNIYGLKQEAKHMMGVELKRCERNSQETQDFLKFLDFLPLACVVQTPAGKLMLNHGATPYTPEAVANFSLGVWNQTSFAYKDDNKMCMWGDYTSQHLNFPKENDRNVGMTIPFHIAKEFMTDVGIVQILSGHQDRVNYGCCKKPNDEDKFWGPNEPHAYAGQLWVLKSFGPTLFTAKINGIKVPFYLKTSLTAIEQVSWWRPFTKETANWESAKNLPITCKINLKGRATKKDGYYEIKGCKITIVEYSDKYSKSTDLSSLLPKLIVNDFKIAILRQDEIGDNAPIEMTMDGTLSKGEGETLNFHPTFTKSDKVELDVTDNEIHVQSSSIFSKFSERYLENHCHMIADWSQIRTTADSQASKGTEGGQLSGIDRKPARNLAMLI